MTVAEVIRARAANELPAGHLAISGYWSIAGLVHSCAPPPARTGDLELYCQDGDFGITDAREPIRVSNREGFVLSEAADALTPYFDDDVAPADIWRTGVVIAPDFEPVPIVVIGHFDDPRADECRPVARQLCRDRLVVDRIAEFGDDLQ
jgi:hypothetical protein